MTARRLTLGSLRIERATDGSCDLVILSARARELIRFTFEPWELPPFGRTLRKIAALLRTRPERRRKRGALRVLSAEGAPVTPTAPAGPEPAVELADDDVTARLVRLPMGDAEPRPAVVSELRRRMTERPKPKPKGGKKR